MSWRDEVARIVGNLEDEHMDVLEQELKTHYSMGAEDEVSRLQDIGLSQLTFKPPSASDRFAQLSKRMEDRTTVYDDTFESTVVDAIKRDGHAAEEIDRIFDDGPDGGLIIDERGELEPIKRVDPDGNARLQSREVDYLWYVNPVAHFDWMTSIAMVEARNAGRVAVHDETDEVERQVWVDPLDESSTVMSARLHGESWETGEMPFLPPVTQLGRARIHPVLEDDTPYTQDIPTPDEFRYEREVWFAQYHAMRQGEAPEENFTEFDIDPSDTENMEFIYGAYLPRNVTQYLPQ